MVAITLLIEDLKLCSIDTPRRSLRRRSHPGAELASKNRVGPVLPFSSLPSALHIWNRGTLSK